MPLLTKAEAARQLGISRTTLYKLIDHGTLSPTPEGLIDTAELGRVLSTLNVHPERLNVHPERPRTPLYTQPVDTYPPSDEHPERPALTSSERQLTSTLQGLVDILREQLQAAQERERDYREQIARLTTMLDQAHQQNQRLLDLPRPAPQETPQDAPGATQPPSHPHTSPGTPGRAPGAASGPGWGSSRRHAPAHRGPAPGAP